ncbi:MAG: hypothetical protein JO363_09865 [Solirubrobacterales bacterium]|nr:hypothetical protein [Solirubrobacterales bacterium]
MAAASVVLLMGACGGGSETSTAPIPRRTAPLLTIFEAQSELFANPGRTLDLLRHLGTDDVKVFMQWNSVAPNSLSHSRPRFDATDPASYPPAAWGPYDAVIRAAAARHLGVDLALEAPAPLWATGPGVPPGTASGFLGAWEPSAKEFGLFVSAVGKRYSGHYHPTGETTPLPKVDFWSIWNEPNYGQQLAPQAIDHSTIEVSPAYYRALLGAAWGGLQQTGHGRDTVLIGEIAPRGHTLGDSPGDFSGMVPLRFIRALYCVDQTLHPLTGTAASQRGCPSSQSGSASFARDNPALFQATGFAFHPYPQAAPPNVGTAPDGLGTDYADFPQLHKLEATLDGAFSAYGSDNRLALYDTEFGYQTNPPETIARAISPALAAGYANQAEYMSWRDPRVVSWDQYLLADPTPGPSSFDTGIEFYDGKPKGTLYDAFRMPVWLPVSGAPAGHPLEVWGDVRPARYAPTRANAPQVARIQFEASNKAKFRTVKQVPITDPYGYFDTQVSFPSSGSVRIEWSYPHGETIHSRTVAITIG